MDYEWWTIYTQTSLEVRARLAANVTTPGSLLLRTLKQIVGDAGQTAVRGCSSGLHVAAESYFRPHIKTKNWLAI